jgi:phosphoglycolate phosphatase
MAGLFCKVRVRIILQRRPLRLRSVPPTGVRSARTIKNYVFDFDGTLVDTLQDVLDSLKLAFNECAVTVQSYDPGKILQFPLREAVRAIAPDITAEQTERVIGRFREHYDTSTYPNTSLMPTVAELLPKLRERSAGMFIVSNKRAVPTIRILDKFHLRCFFSGIFNSDMDKGGKTVTKRELLSRALVKHSLAKNETAYIGDSEGDVAAAKENGVLAIAVQNGYGDLFSFRSEPDCSVRQIIEILAV